MCVCHCVYHCMYTCVWLCVCVCVCVWVSACTHVLDLEPVTLVMEIIYSVCVCVCVCGGGGGGDGYARARACVCVCVREREREREREDLHKKTEGCHGIKKSVVMIQHERYICGNETRICHIGNLDVASPPSDVDPASGGCMLLVNGSWFFVKLFKNMEYV